MTPAQEKLRRWRNGALKAFADIRPGEGRLALSMAALFFLVIGSYYLIKPVRNVLWSGSAPTNLGVAMKMLSNYVNHIADTPLDRELGAFAWQPATAGCSTAVEPGRAGR